MNLFKKHFYFSGRLNRKPFAIRAALVVVIQLVVEVFLELLYYPKVPMSTNKYTWLILLLLILLLILEWFFYANANRRFHDLGKSSRWTYFLFCLAISAFTQKTNFGLIYQAPLLLYLLLKKGEPGPNKYGSDQLHPNAIYGQAGNLQKTD